MEILAHDPKHSAKSLTAVAAAVVCLGLAASGWSLQQAAAPAPARSAAAQVRTRPAPPARAVTQPSARFTVVPPPPSCVATSTGAASGCVRHWRRAVRDLEHPSVIVCPAPAACGRIR